MKLVWQNGQEYKVNDEIQLSAETNVGTEIVLMQNSRILRKTKGNKAKFSLAPNELGKGPVRIWAVASDQAKRGISSPPMEIMVR